MIDTRAPRGEYHITFDTESTAGFIRSVKVTLEADMLPDDTGAPEADQERYAINLCTHPLYKELERYVHANPSEHYNFDQRARMAASNVFQAIGIRPSTGVFDSVTKMIRAAMMWSRSHR